MYAGVWLYLLGLAVFAVTWMAITGISAVPPLILFGFLLALLYEKPGPIVPGLILHIPNHSVALLGQ